MKVRYYINLNQPKEHRNVTPREIRDDKDEQKFNDKLIRCKHIVETNKDGIVLDELDQHTEAEYNELIATKKRLQEALEREVNYLKKIEEQDKTIVTLRYQLEETTKSNEIKPLETHDGNENDKDDMTVVENEKVDSVAINANNDDVTENKTTPVKRKMKRATTKKTKKPVKK